MLASEPDVDARAALQSPPRGWPASFKQNKFLGNFLNKTIKAKKARLTTAPPADIAAEVTALGDTFAADAVANAARVKDALGWPDLRGFAIYELADVPDKFVAAAHAWNLHPRNIWVDMTPRATGLASVLLVEADVDAALARGGVARAERAVVDLYDGDAVDAAAAKPPASGPPQRSAPEGRQEAAEEMPTAAEPVSSVSEELEAAAPPPQSYDEILAALSLGPKALDKKNGVKPRKGPAPAPDGVVASFSASSSVKTWWAGERKQKMRWPPPHSNVRMRLRRNGTFELEARCWGKAREEADPAGVLMEDWFASLEYGDIDAASLHVTGSVPDDSWRAGGGGALKVETVEERRNGKRPPPLTAEDVYKVCGRSLANQINGHRKGTSWALTIDKDVDWHLNLHEDADDGWAKDDDE